MKKIDKKTQQRIFMLSEELREKVGQINALIGELNETRNELAGIFGDAADAAESYYDERSERWQEGDTGTAYSDWKDKLRETADSVAEEIEEFEEPEWLSEVIEEPPVEPNT